jgi:hypothetical protein
MRSQDERMPVAVSGAGMLRGCGMKVAAVGVLAISVIVLRW